MDRLLCIILSRNIFFFKHHKLSRNCNEFGTIGNFLVEQNIHIAGPTFLSGCASYLDGSKIKGAEKKNSLNFAAVFA